MRQRRSLCPKLNLHRWQSSQSACKRRQWLKLAFLAGSRACFLAKHRLLRRQHPWQARRLPKKKSVSAQKVAATETVLAEANRVVKDVVTVVPVPKDARHVVKAVAATGVAIAVNALNAATVRASATTPKPTQRLTPMQSRRWMPPSAYRPTPTALNDPAVTESAPTAVNVANVAPPATSRWATQTHRVKTPLSPRR
jgi:hypothetical protein